MQRDDGVVVGDGVVVAVGVGVGVGDGVAIGVGVVPPISGSQHLQSMHTRRAGQGTPASHCSLPSIKPLPHTDCGVGESVGVAVGVGGAIPPPCVQPYKTIETMQHNTSVQARAT